MIECYFIDGALTDIKRDKKSDSESKSKGATTLFEGTVREDVIDSKKVTSIEFTTQKEIAHSLCIDLLKKYKKKYTLINATIYHSVGIVNTGEVCFRVEVNASHRKEAFLALPEIVNEFKATIPVFGKEILEDNSYVWKKNRE